LGEDRGQAAVLLPFKANRVGLYYFRVRSGDGAATRLLRFFDCDCDPLLRHSDGLLSPLDKSATFTQLDRNEIRFPRKVSLCMNLWTALISQKRQR